MITSARRVNARRRLGTGFLLTVALLCPTTCNPPLCAVSLPKQSLYPLLYTSRDEAGACTNTWRVHRRSLFAARHQAGDWEGPYRVAATNAGPARRGDEKRRWPGVRWGWGRGWRRSDGCGGWLVMA